MKTKQKKHDDDVTKPKYLPISQYHVENDFLIRPFLTILEGAFVFQGYEPIKEDDYEKHYQLFPDQESFISHVEGAIATGYLPASSALISGKKVKVIDTYKYLEWTIENVSEDRFAPFLNCLWITFSAKKEFHEKKFRNRHSYRSKEETRYKEVVIEAARAIRQQDNDIPIFIMIEHIQEKYAHIDKKERTADTLKGWIQDAGISTGLTDKLTQSEEKIFRNKKYSF